MKRLSKILNVALLVLGAVGLGVSELGTPVFGMTGLLEPQVKVERDIVYCDCKGVPLKMDIYFSEQATVPMPAVVYVHGGGWYSGDKSTGGGLREVPELVERGYLVAAINYRLAPKYQFPAQIEDLICAVRFLRDNAATYSLDPERIGVFGDSAGGHLAALIGLADDYTVFGASCNCSVESSRVQAVVDMYGPTDLMLTFERDKSPLMEHVFGTSDNQSEIIKQASPVTYVSGDAPPFLIIQGEKDEQVFPDQSQELYAQLVSFNVPATLVMVKNSGHSFKPVDGPISPTRGDITNLVADFFDKYLKGA